MIKNVILDWSGTLADDLSPVIKATNHVLEEYGKPTMSRDEFCKEFSLPFEDFYRRFLPEASIEELDARYHYYFDPLNEHVELLPFAINFLQFCQRTKRRTFLLSTINPEHFNKQAARLKVKHYFEHPYTGIWDKAKRIHSILEEKKLHPEETIFIGDMVHDIETAHHGGITGVAVTTGYDTVEKFIAAKAKIILKNLQELQRLMECGECSSSTSFPNAP